MTKVKSLFSVRHLTVLHHTVLELVLVSSAMRNESFGIETYSPYQDKDLTDIKVFDGGDLELCFGSPESALNDIENFSSKNTRQR